MTASPSSPDQAPRTILPKRSRDRGFSLIEMLAALLGTVVVLAAATGFLLTAFLRERAVLDAQRLETLHDDLAQDMGRAVKIAEAAQIFHALADYRNGSLAVGARSGNVLVCVRTNATGERIETEFAFAGEEVTCTSRIAGAVISRQSYPHFRLPAGTAELFSMDGGVMQATWEVETRQDLVPFRVCATPLAMH